MAHKLHVDTATGKASMFYVNEVPWHGLGQKLDSPATAAEAIEAARLNWEVAKLPLYAVNGKESHQLPRRFAIVRKDLWGKSNCPFFGIVGSGYTPLQNRDAFTFFDEIVGKDAAIYHTAGALGDGERVWILAKLPTDIRVVGDDIVHKYLLLANSHDGSSAVQVKFTPIRVVCNNTLTLALRSGPSVRIAHTKRVQERLRAAQALLGIINRRFDTIEKTFKRMTEVPMAPPRLQEYLEAVFPVPTPEESEGDPQYERALQRVTNNRLWAGHFFDQGAGNGLAGVRGTLWAAYNGVTELVDHRQLPSLTEDSRLDSIWFGDGYYVKARAYRIAEEKLKEWRN